MAKPTPKNIADGAQLVAKNLFLDFKADSIKGNKMTGISSGMGNLDSYDDVIFPGAFPPEVLADFLAAGFIADGHDWTKIVAIPLVAEDRGNQLYSECEFHSTADAQAVKTKCAERIAAGKSVGLSIGFGMMESSYKMFANGAALLAYAKANGFDMSLFDQEGITACTRRCRAILRIDKLYEYSPVAVPANPAAWAMAMKTATIIVEKGQYLGEYIEGSMTMAAIARLTDALYYGVFYNAMYNDTASPEECRAMLAGGLDEYCTYVLRVYDAIMCGDDLSDSDGVDDAAQAIKSFWPKPETRNGTPARVILKEGRTLSKATRDTLTMHRQALADCLQNIDDLLGDENEDPDGDEDSDASKAARLTALREIEISQLRRTAKLRSADYLLATY